MREYNDQILEAAFFCAGRPLSSRKLAEEFGITTREMRKNLTQIEKFLKKHGELKLTRLQADTDKWQLHREISEEHLEIVTALIGDFPRIDAYSLLERQILAIIAFSQPVSKAKIWKTLTAGKTVDKKIPINVIEQQLQILIKEGFIKITQSSNRIQYEVTPYFSSVFGFEETKIKLKNQVVKYLQLKDEDIITKQQS